MKAALLFVLLLTPAMPSEFHFAPVYSYVDEHVLERSGAVRVHDHIGYELLYCIEPEKNAVWLNCVVHTPEDRLVLIDVRATGFAL